MKVNKWQYRNLKMFEACSRQKRIDSDYYVEGYAATFERYLLFEDENGPLYVWIFYITNNWRFALYFFFI